MLEKIKGVFKTKCKKALALLLAVSVILVAVPIVTLPVSAVDTGSGINWPGSKLSFNYRCVGAVFDKDGSVYVTDWSNGYLKKYTSAGVLDPNWAYQTTNIGNIPIGVCLDNDGNVYVGGQSSGTIYKFVKKTDAATNQTTYDKTVYKNLGCQGLTCDPDGNIYVNARTAVYKFSKDGQQVWSVAATASLGLCRDNDGSLYATDESTRRVVKITPDGKIDTTFGTNGYLTLSQTLNGTAINTNIGLPTFYDNTLFVSCYGNGVVVKITGNGQNVENVITGASPVMFVKYNNKYIVPNWTAQYIEEVDAPNLDIKSDHFKFTMNPLKVTEGSTTPVTFKIESTSTKNYSVKAQLIDKVTGQVVPGVNSTTATLQDGGANVVVTPPAGGWKKGVYGIQMVFSNTVGTMTLSDTLEVGVAMGVGYYVINYNTPDNGTIVSKTDYVEMGKNAPATFTVNPDAGYSLDKTNTTVSNGDLEYSGNQVTIKNITADVNVNVAFAEASAISDITGVPTSWTNQNRTVSFTAGGDVASVNVVGNVSGHRIVTKSDNTYSFVAAQNDTYTVTVTDSSGKTSTTPIEVTKIDKTTPVLSVSHTPEDLSKATENNVVFTFSNTANNPSGTTYYVQKDDGAFAPISGSTYTVSAPDSSTYHFKAVSGAGTESPISFQYTVNAVNPVFTPITVNTNGYNTGDWTSSDVTLSLSGGLSSDAFGKYQYSTNTNDWNDVTGSSVTVGSNFNGTYYFRAVSKGGSTGSTTEGTSVKVDKATGFTISATGKTSSICKSDTVTLGITGIGASGIAKVEVQKDKGDWTDITSSYTNGYAVNANGSYQFRVTNGAGVAALSSTPLVYNKIDTAVPTVSLSANGYTENTWTTGNVTIDVTNGNTANLGTAVYEYSADNGATYQPFNGKLVITNDTNTTYLFKVISQSGVDSVPLSFTVKKDATAPTGTVTIGKNSWKEFLNTITFGLFCKDTATVTVAGADATSGVQKVEYYKSATALTLDQVKAVTSWTVYQSALSEAPVDTKSFIYYIKLTDNAGNVGYISSDAVTFDTTAPTISGITNGATYYVDQAITATDTNLDAITVNGNTVVSGYKLSADVNATYKIVVSDKAGNSVTYTVNTKTIANIAESIQGLTVSNVKSSDKTAIEAVLAAVNDALNTTNNGATSDQIKALNAIKDNTTQLLNKIGDVTNAIADITNKTNGIATDNAKSSDKTNLDSVLSTINDLLQNKSGNLTDNEKTALEQKKKDVQNALSKITDVAKAITDVINKIKDITKDTVKKEDQTNLKRTAEELNKLLNDYKNNLTDGEKNSINDNIKNIQDLFSSLDQVKTVEDQISKLPNADTVTKADKDTVDNANKAFNDLSDHQETLVDPRAVTKLKDVTNALSKLLLEDPATGIKVEGVDGTTFDINTELVVTPIKDTLDTGTKQLFAVGVANAAEGQVIAQLYDIHLLLNGQKIQPDGKVKITLKLTEEMKNYTDLHVTYITDDGKVTIIPHEQNGDVITFYTDHFSNYGIIGTPINSNSTGNTNTTSTTNSANTGETSPFIPCTVAVAASLFLIIAAKMKRSYKI